MRVLTLFRRLLFTALVLCVIFMSAAMAEDSNFSFAITASGDSYAVTGYTGNDTSVKVPDWHAGKPVTEIGEGAFQGNAKIKSVSLPSTIKTIGKAAFKNCTALSSMSTYTASAEPPAPERLPGDVDLNGAVDAQDGLLLLQYNAGWNVSIDSTNADVDGNGAINLNDAVLVLKYGAGENVTLK